jgi:hypothetical protein
MPNSYQFQVHLLSPAATARASILRVPSTLTKAAYAQYHWGALTGLIELVEEGYW